MYWVEYYCPRQSPFWQRAIQAYPDFNFACMQAQIMKPPRGSARVVDSFGRVLYSI
jgi:hypothetical protein